MDPLDYFLYEEFYEPRPRYACPACGQMLPDGDAAWSDAAECLVVRCPACGQEAALPEDEGE